MKFYPNITKTSAGTGRKYWGLITTVKGLRLQLRSKTEGQRVS